MGQRYRIYYDNRFFIDSLSQEERGYRNMEEKEVMYKSEKKDFSPDELVIIYKARLQSAKEAGWEEARYLTVKYLVFRMIYMCCNETDIQKFTGMSRERCKHFMDMYNRENGERLFNGENEISLGEYLAKNRN